MSDSGGEVNENVQAETEPGNGQPEAAGGVPGGGANGGTSPSPAHASTDSQAAPQGHPEQSEGEPTEGTAEAAEAETASVEVDPLELAQREVAQLKEQLLRTAADFDNFRKRSRKDVSEARRKGTQQALDSILPVADNLERAVQAASSSSDLESVVEGIRMVLDSFIDALDRVGVEKIESQGQSFDPAVHEAIQQAPSAEHPVGTVLSVLQPGYRYRSDGRLLRAALVVVSTAAPTAAPTAEQPPKEPADGRPGSEPDATAPESKH